MANRVLVLSSSRTGANSVTGQLSEKRLGVSGPWGTPESVMRLVTTSDVIAGDTLTAEGSTYRVTVVHSVGSRLVCELVKEV